MGFTDGHSGGRRHAELIVAFGIVGVALSGCRFDDCPATPVAGNERKPGYTSTLDELVAHVTVPQELEVTWLETAEVAVPGPFGATESDKLHVEITDPQPFMQSYGFGSDGCIPGGPLRATVRVLVVSESGRFNQSSEADLQVLPAGQGLSLPVSIQVRAKVASKEDVVFTSLWLGLSFDNLGTLVQASGDVILGRDGGTETTTVVTGP